MIMVKADKQDDEKVVADEAAALSGLADASAKLFAEQAAAMAVFTAYGIGIATQMTGMMLGALRGPADAVEMTEAQAKADGDSKVVHFRPVQTAKAKVPSQAPAVESPTTKARPGKPVVTKKPIAEPVAKTLAPKPVKVGKKGAPISGDDLKKIPGIGPRLEKVLNDRGIVGYGDVAGLSKAALKKLDVELGLEGRVIRDDWAGQAKALSGGKG
jgi:NADH-quinone oxidoreductase subunit E